MGFNCGIVGLPNVGKSTLFNALTKAGIAAENFPFCTIEPNTGLVPMPDARLDKLKAIVNPQKVVPTSMEFVDIAGLVAGASKGEGLGNQFLGNIRETHAIAHVVRCFDDEQVVHVSNSIDPARDIEIINTELQLSDLDSVDGAIARLARLEKSGNKDAIARKAFFQTLLEHINQGKAARTLACTQEQLQDVKSLYLLTMKPVLYIANVDEEGSEDNPYLDRVTKIAEADGAEVVVVCCKLEAEIAELDESERAEFLADLGMAEAGLDRVIRAGYKLLALQTYFTAGVKEVRAWTVRKNATAPQAAGVIHTDFEKGFIRAEVIGYEDFIAHKGESGAREAGKWRLEGKTYIVQDGDVVHFRFNL